MPESPSHPVDAASVSAASAALIDADDAGRLTGLLGLIQDPLRLRVLFALSATKELCVGDLALAIASTDDAVSYALKLLRMAGMVSFRKQGRAVFYHLSDGFPHQLLEHCLRQLLAIAVPEEA